MTPRAVLVTGAGSGIGAAAVIAAAQEGASVAAVDVDGTAIAAIVQTALARGAHEALALEADVRQESEVQAAFAACRNRLGVPTSVLANAGIEVSGLAHEMSLSEWHRQLDTNLTGAFLTAREAVRHLLDAKSAGSVVFTSSPAAFVGFAGGRNAAYAASKGGVTAMVRSLALDYAPARIRVNAVVPGATDTPLMTAHLPSDQREAARAEIVARARDQVPLGRLGDPAEVAEAIRWLWSDSASFVTGSHLMVDGGLMAKSANSF